jgi:tripeptidyl-peptidase I
LFISIYQLLYLQDDLESDTSLLKNPRRKMRVVQISFVLLSVASLGVSSPSSTHVVHEQAVESADLWAKIGGIQKDGLLPVRVGLVQQNLDHGHDLLMERYPILDSSTILTLPLTFFFCECRSDPNHSNYGKHLSEDEVIDLFAPHESSVTAVRQWLESEGIHIGRISQSFNKQWLQFHATVHELEQLLHTTYAVYRHVETGTRKVGSDHYSIPKNLRAHIDYITPGATRLKLRDHDTPFGRRPLRNPEDPPNAGSNIPSGPCGKYMKPHCVRELYDFPRSHSSVQGNNLGIYEQEPYSQKSLSTSFRLFNP